MLELNTCGYGMSIHMMLMFNKVPLRQALGVSELWCLEMNQGIHSFPYAYCLLKLKPQTPLLQQQQRQRVWQRPVKKNSQPVKGEEQHISICTSITPLSTLNHHHLYWEFPPKRPHELLIKKSSSSSLVLMISTLLSVHVQQKKEMICVNLSLFANNSVPVTMTTFITVVSLEMLHLIVYVDVSINPCNACKGIFQ